MPERISIIIAVVLFLVVGLKAKNRTTSIEGFSTKRNRLSWFVTSAGVSMTFVGGAALLNMASLGYSYRWYTLIDPLAMMTGILISAYFVNNYRNNKGVTISQLLSGSNKKLSLYIGIITSTVFLLIISAQFVAFSKLLAPYFPGIHPTLLMIIPSGIILLYVFMGGFAAVTNTDVLQLFLLFIFLLVPVGYYLLTHQSALPVNTGGEARFTPMPGELMIYFCIFALFIPVSQDINVRAKSAKDERHATTGIILGGIFYCLIVIACSYIGITLAEHGIKIKDPEQAFPTFFKNFYPTFGIFPILAGMAAIWSTLDTYLVNCITSVAQDIFKGSAYFKDVNERKLILTAGLIVFSLAVLITLYFNNVLPLILTALLVYISVLVPVAIGKKMKMNNNIIFVVSLFTVFIILICEVQKIVITPKGIIYPAGAILLMLAARFYQHVAAET